MYPTKHIKSNINKKQYKKHFFRTGRSLWERSRAGLNLNENDGVITNDNEIIMNNNE